MFSLVHRLGFVDVTARALREARYLRPREGTYWGSTAYLRRGPLAVEIEGMWGRGVRGPSRILEIDLATGRRRVFLTSPGGITDLATDRAGKALLWVDDGTIHWRVLGEQGALAGGFVKAAFFPG